MGAAPEPAPHEEGAASTTETLMPQPEPIAQPRRRPLKPIAWFYGLLLANLLAFGWASQVTNSDWVEFTYAGVDILLVGGFVWRRWDAVGPYLKLHWPSPRAWGGFALNIVALFVVGNLVFYGLRELGLPFIRMTDAYIDAGWSLWSMLLMLSVFPAVIEELAFRGVIQSGLEGHLTPTEALWVQAALFGVMHLSPAIFITHTLMGWFFGRLRSHSGSLYPGMLAHGLWNGWVVWEELNHHP